MKIPAPHLLAGTAAASFLIAGVVTAFGPASAVGEDRPSTLTVTDPAHDVRELDARDTWPQLAAAVPSRSNGDVQDVVITYGSSAITIVTEFAELRRPTERAPKLIAGGTLRSSARESGDVYVIATSRDVGGRAMLDGDRSCNVRHRLDYRQNRLVLRVPADCLGNPDSIRFQGAAVVRRTTHEGRFVQVDVAPGNGLRLGHYSARVYRPEALLAE